MPELDSNGTARVGGGHRGVTEIVRSLESTVVGCLARPERTAGYGAERQVHVVAARQSDGGLVRG